MQSNNKMAYRISISAPEGRAHLVCVSYPLDINESQYGLDFYELVWSTTRTAVAIPSSRQATFKEELRCMHQASKAFAAGGESEVQFIAKCMKDVYGNDASVAVSVIDKSMQCRASFPDPSPADGRSA